MVFFFSSSSFPESEPGEMRRGSRRERTKGVRVVARVDDEFALLVKDVISEVKNVDKFSLEGGSFV